jgi:two-component system chemotaxis response regulator CheY
MRGGHAPKVVFCSGHTTLDRIAEALDLGADEYLMKPFDGDIIAGKLALAGAL